MNEVAVLEQKPIEGISEIAGDLLEKPSAGLRRDISNLHATRFELDDEEYQVADEPGFGEDFDGEEIGGSVGAPMSIEKGTPSDFAGRLWVDAVFMKHAGNGAASDLMCETRQRTADSRVAPRRVFGGERDDELFELALDRRPAGRTAAGAIVLFLDETSVPAQQSARGNDGRALFQRSSTKLLGAKGKPTVLSVSEEEASSAQLLAQNAIFFHR